MTLYIDIQNKKLVQSPTSDRSVPTPAFMQGDNEPLILHLLEAGSENLYQEKTLEPTTDFLRVAIAKFSGYPKSLTYASGYTINPNGGAEILLPLNTVNIENALQDNEAISAYLEVEYSNTDGRVITVLQTPCRVKNDLVDNAPAIELQDQFYNKVYTDTIFSKKSANLLDLANMAQSRTNLDVYSTQEIDAKVAGVTKISYDEETQETSVNGVFKAQSLYAGGKRILSKYDDGAYVSVQCHCRTHNISSSSSAFCFHAIVSLAQAVYSDNTEFGCYGNSTSTYRNLKILPVYSTEELVVRIARSATLFQEKRYSFPSELWADFHYISVAAPNANLEFYLDVVLQTPTSTTDWTTAQSSFSLGGNYYVGPEEDYFAPLVVKDIRVSQASPKEYYDGIVGLTAYELPYKTEVSYLSYGAMVAHIGSSQYMSFSPYGSDRQPKSNIYVSQLASFSWSASQSSIAVYRLGADSPVFDIKFILRFNSAFETDITFKIEIANTGQSVSATLKAGDTQVSFPEFSGV